MITVTIHPDVYSIRVDGDTDVLFNTGAEVHAVLEYAPDDQTVVWKFANPFVNPEGY